MPSSRSFYSGVFILSGLLMALQVLQARIFSVTTWYHLSFLVISVAMFGLTLGALHVHKGDAKEQERDHGKLMSQATLSFGLYTLLALGAQMMFPIASTSAFKTVMSLPLIASCTIPSYYFAGYALSLAMTRAPYPPARTYGFDLIGAAAGCLFALGVMETLDAPSAVMLIAAGGMLCAFLFAPQDKFRTGVMTAVLCGFALMNAFLPRHIIYPVWVKDAMVGQAELSHDEWNSISRVTVSNEVKDHSPFLWGPSKTLPDDLKTSFYILKIDGDAGTPLNKFGGDCKKGLSSLDYDVTTIAYAIPGLEKAGVIGVGGGRDVLSACKAGIKDITAMDVNAVQIKLLSEKEPFKSYTNIHKLEGVKLIHSEARSWFASHPETFDIIQMSLIDTWAATGAGAFALSENGLYTVEAWRTFLSRLNEGGVMTVSRWYISDAHSEVERLVSLAMASLFETGAKEPGKHIFMAATDRIATLVVSRDPFTGKQLKGMKDRAKKMKFDILISPETKTGEGTLADILATKERAGLDRLAQTSVFDVSPPTDQRPFFFNQVRLSEPFRVLGLIAENNPSAMLGHARAILNLYIIIFFSFLMVAGAIIWPLKKEIKLTSSAFIASGTAWFALIGLGFMLVEISLLQRLSVYLGHPSYGLSIVLFSLVLSTGIGSLICDRFPLKSRFSRMAWATLTAIAGTLAIFAIDTVTTNFAALAVCVTMPLGCLLGFGFPTGMNMAKEISGHPTAWFWGINGAAGVMGSAIAIGLNIALGIGTTMLIGALCYLALVIPAGMKIRKK